ncbi:cytochrome C, partial [bacterium]|nr:cytochrome C [bacterium]
MENKKAWWQRPGLRIIIALVLLILLGGAVGGIYFTQIPPEQPIQFPHSFHVGVGAQCTYCHTTAATGPTAGLPSTAKCWGCHQQVQKKSPELDKLAAFAKAGAEIPWVP